MDPERGAPPRASDGSEEGTEWCIDLEKHGLESHSMLLLQSSCPLVHASRLLTSLPHPDVVAAGSKARRALGLAPHFSSSEQLIVVEAMFSARPGTCKHDASTSRPSHERPYVQPWPREVSTRDHNDRRIRRPYTDPA